MRTLPLLACLLSTVLSPALRASEQQPAEEKEISHYQNIFYYPAEEEEQAKKIMSTLLDRKSSRAIWLPIGLSSMAASTEKEKQQAREAIAHGVIELPCVILCYEGKPYARLYGEDINPVTIALSESRAETAPKLEPSFDTRLAASLYQLHSVGIERMDLLKTQRWVRECRALADSEECSTEQQQFLRLQYLYPLLLHEFTLMYEGGHNMETEAKFLEAISELEMARDLAPSTRLGRTAYSLREELRTARLKAKIYD